MMEKYRIKKITLLYFLRQKVRAMTSTLPDAEEEERTAQVRMEESFTIHLG